MQPSARPGAPCRIAKAVGAEAGASNARCRAYCHPMRKLKPTEARQRRFQEALADTGSVSAAAVAGTSRTRVYELRKADQAFASAWQEAEEIAADRLEDEAGRRALEGIPELLVSGGGKLVRDDEGNPITVRRYSDNLLLALLKAKRPPRRERSVRFQLPALCDGPGCLDSFRGGIS